MSELEQLQFDSSRVTNDSLDSTRRMLSLCEDVSTGGGILVWCCVVWLCVRAVWCDVSWDRGAHTKICLCSTVHPPTIVWLYMSYSDLFLYHNVTATRVIVWYLLKPYSDIWLSPSLTVSPLLYSPRRLVSGLWWLSMIKGVSLSRLC